MTDRGTRVLERMLERLFAAIVRGPSIDCRPHNSRQRLDLMELSALGDLDPAEVMAGLLSERGSGRLTARIERPPNRSDAAGNGGDSHDAAGGVPDGDPEVERVRRAWERQQSVLRKLRHIAEEARTYEEDTGVHVLHVGFPMLHIVKGAGGAQRRILAPLAFVPIKLSVSTGAKGSVEMVCRYGGEARVMPNEALLAWIEQQTGKRVEELFSDEEGTDPWREICEITRAVVEVMELSAPDWLQADAQDAAESDPGSNEDGRVDRPARAAGVVPSVLSKAPNSEDDGAPQKIVLSAVLGLYPMSNQGLLRDTQAMLSEGPGDGPVRSFLEVDSTVTSGAADDSADAVERRLRRFDEERFVQLCDPCQARAVRLARDERGLVIHGPPGTGKSQTITNIIADHLSRGERVLFVCDKRTALDVVANRLEHVGLGGFCALIHDAQRDQRDLYMSVREQLERLAETHPKPRADRRIEKIDAELQELHGELLTTWRLLMLDPDEPADSGVPDLNRAGDEGSFHDLVGRWLGIEVDPAYGVSGEALLGISLDELARHEIDVRDGLQRGVEVDYASNPWPEAIGIGLDQVLSVPADRLREALETCVRAAHRADETIAAGLSPLDPRKDVRAQATEFAELADALEGVLRDVAPEVRSMWAGRTEEQIKQARTGLDSCAEMAEIAAQARADPEIDLVLRSASMPVTTLGTEIAALANYRAVASKWWGAVAFGAKKRARTVLNRFGLALDAGSAERVEAALRAERARLVVRAALELAGVVGPTTDVDRAALLERFAGTRCVVGLLDRAGDMGMRDSVGGALAGALSGTEVIGGLRQMPKRAAAIAELMQAMATSTLFNKGWMRERLEEACRHEPCGELFQTMTDRFGTLETSLRVREIVSKLPERIGTSMRQLLAGGAAAEAGWLALVRGCLEASIVERLRRVPELHRLDGRRIEGALARLSQLQGEKMALVRDSVASRWIQLQRERLLVGTGSRLNSMGAELKRRLLTRGRRALRLRQVIQHGQGIEGGDPLFDLRPVWMASPETVAQIMPRTAMFDLVVFDEASQCRLEEALPVLMRAGRFVVAGDPKQLPPTRFFESAVVASDELSVESDQDLFEAQQSEIEDLLMASLNIEIDQSYLDVHYRSRNADLIEFSNRQFYNSRLQAIPGHPKNRTRFAPLVLTHVGGTYHESQNVEEARAVVQIVRDLLKRAEPPSIGIACFNVVQRDLILDELDDAAEADPSFGRLLAKARTRRGHGSFEGLFVKNLENVQGDERDHIIISTTYGPNREGKFYRRFGPLLQQGGGRRLNVLVTRAREEVHLVSSIPPEHYRALPPVPEGQTPGGAWLLFAYLHYAERLAEAYENAHEVRERSHEQEVAAVRASETSSRSALTDALAVRLAQRVGGSETYWGNDGFCVDIALDHPARIDDVTIGVLTDMTRFKGASDPVEWELFRTQILLSQSWELSRVWSPMVFRDLVGVEGLIEQAVEACLSRDEDPEAMKTWRPGDSTASEEIPGGEER